MIRHKELWKLVTCRRELSWSKKRWLHQHWRQSQLCWSQKRWLYSGLGGCQQRFNALNIQMLTDTLHRQIFPAERDKEQSDQAPPSSSSPPYSSSGCSLPSNSSMSSSSSPSTSSSSSKAKKRSPLSSSNSSSNSSSFSSSSPSFTSSSSPPFTSPSPSPSSSSSSSVSAEGLSRVRDHLQKFGLLHSSGGALPDVHLNLPPLFGDSVEEHFHHIASQQVQHFKTLAHRICQPPPSQSSSSSDSSSSSSLSSQLSSSPSSSSASSSSSSSSSLSSSSSSSSLTPWPPALPQEWAKQKGWTKYHQDGSWESVPFPQEEVLVFDVEVLMRDGNFPTMAAALSPTHWYSWTADAVLQDRLRWTREPQLADLIPLESGRGSSAIADTKRLVIGHNVAFDRSFVKEQYFIQGSQLRFLDTMSMHIAVCGLTSFQRILFQSSLKDSARREVREHSERQKMFNMASTDAWKHVSSMNNLNAVYQLHCQGEPLDKQTRDVFVSGTMDDVRNDFQSLMTYCAKDVLATHAVFTKLWPQFLQRFPHPVTLGGMLEMGTAYLPVDSRWPRYIQHANATYEESQRELRKLLISLADEACHLLEDEAYKDDPWLWDLDWTVANFRMKKKKTSSPKSLKTSAVAQQPSQTTSTTSSVSDSDPSLDEEDLDMLTFLQDPEEREENQRLVDEVYATAERLPKIPTFMAGYPAWYRELCPRPNDPEWYPGPSNISPQCRLTPKLMRLTWDGYPLHYDAAFGWGYLVPVPLTTTPSSLLDSELDRQEEADHPQEEQPPACKFPVRAYLDFMRQTKPELFATRQTTAARGSADPALVLGQTFEQRAMDPREVVTHWDTARPQPSPTHRKKKGNAGDGPHDIGLPGCLFYRIPHKDGSKKRVGNPLAKDYLHRVEDGTLRATSCGDGEDHGANRALLLSKLCSYWKNNQDRIEGQMVAWMKKGELPKYITKQADYDALGQYGAIIPRIAVAGTVTRRAVEPTWLTASNAYEDRIGSELKAMVHTPPGYHFVGADVDSQELWIAAILGDAHFNKIHGCTALGWMTLQGNKADKTDLHSKTAELARVTRDQAKILNYGRIYGAGQQFAEQLLLQFNPNISPHEARTTARDMFRKTKGERNGQGQWVGGSESFMFNALEKVANSERPTTPVLGCRISKALEPQYVLDDFLTSRVNWVVQSSAVDYLHLMLVCMRWLLDAYNIKARFCISIHDEVRYLVASPDRYRCGLALQITNLLTRAMFAQRLGMTDLPQAVAFFSAVDVDQCLRKEVTMDCRTPSNPQGVAQGYSIPQGEALSIWEVIDRTKGKLTKT